MLNQVMLFVHHCMHSGVQINEKKKSRKEISYYNISLFYVIYPYVRMALLISYPNKGN